MADFGGDRHGLRQGREGEPVPIPGQKGGREQCFIGADGNRVSLHVFFADVHRLAQGDAQALALAQGVTDCAPVGSHHLAVYVQILSCRIGFAGVAGEKSGVVPIGNKADILAVVLAGVDEALLLGNLPDFFFGQVPQRELNVGHLILIQTGQKIGLILGSIFGLAQQIPAGFFVLANPGIVPGYHIVTAQNPGPIQQSLELQVPVAVNTGVGGQTGLVAADKFLYDFLFKSFLEIKDVVGNSQPVGHAAGILYIVQGTAGSGFARKQVVIIQPHGGADTVKAALQHQKCGHRTVHTAAHADHCLFWGHVGSSHRCYL